MELLSNFSNEPADSNCLQPAADAGSNKVFTVDLEYAQVKRLARSELVPTMSEWGMIVLALGLIFIVHGSEHRARYRSLC